MTNGLILFVALIMALSGSIFFLLRGMDKDSKLE